MFSLADFQEANFVKLYILCKAVVDGNELNDGWLLVNGRISIGEPATISPRNVKIHGIWS